MEYIKSKEWLEYEKLLKERPELFIPSPTLEIITDPEQINNFYIKTKQRLGVIYSSKWNTLLVDLVKNINGDVFTYERIIQTATGDAVVVIPKYQGNYLLLKQFRHAIRTEQYAFPRGFGENGLSGEENAKKELMEYCLISSSIRFSNAQSSVENLNSFIPHNTHVFCFLS